MCLLLCGKVKNLFSWSKKWNPRKPKDTPCSLLSILPKWCFFEPRDPINKLGFFSVFNLNDLKLSFHNFGDLTVKVSTIFLDVPVWGLFSWWGLRKYSWTGAGHVDLPDLDLKRLHRLCFQLEWLSCSTVLLEVSLIYIFKKETTPLFSCSLVPSISLSAYAPGGKYFLSSFLNSVFPRGCAQG